MRSRKKQESREEILRQLLPRVTMHDFQQILEIADRGHLRHLPPSISVWQAVTTHVRHNHTDYDHLLDDGYDADSARHFVLDDINDKLSEWGSAKRVDGEEPDHHS